MNSSDLCAGPTGVCVGPGAVPSSPDPHALCLREPEVMGSLGVSSKDVMRDLRTEVLVQGTDWDMVGNRVMYSKPAAEKLASALAGFPGAAAKILLAQKNAAVCPVEDVGCPVLSDSEKTPPAPNAEECGPILNFPSPEKKVAFVRRVQKHVNRRVLIAELPGVGEIAVAVRDCRNFVPNSKTDRLLVRAVGDGRWEFAGNPDHPETHQGHLPRYPGRW